MQLFYERGFEETTLDDIAGGLGIGRRTLFRYFDSKNDMVWGDFGGVLARLRDELKAHPDRYPTHGHPAGRGYRLEHLSR